MSIVNKLIAENVLNGRSKLQSENENCRKQLALEIRGVSGVCAMTWQFRCDGLPICLNLIVA
jgi:hypothetical protein